MKNYKQLTLLQSYQIEALLQAGLSQTLIANQLGVHRVEINRELKRSIALRGKTSGVYIAQNTNLKSQNKHKFKVALLNAAIKQTIAIKMRLDTWIPQLISYKWK